MASFKAIVIEKADKGQTVALNDFDEKDLMDGDVTVAVEWSTAELQGRPRHHRPGAGGAPLPDDPRHRFRGRGGGLLPSGAGSRATG